MKKFGAKRFTALIMALALVTIGGVYATWTFSENTTTGSAQNFSITLAGRTTSSEKGVFSIEKNSTIYIVDQYSNALSSINSTYSYVQAGGGTRTINDSPNSGDTTTEVYNYYAYYDTATTYKMVTDKTIVYSAGATVTTSDRSTASTSTSAPSGVNNYTAALCTYADSYLRIKFTPDASTQGTDVYNYGITTKFNFGWNSQATKPTITVDDNSYYDASGANTIDIYNLDENEYAIRPYQTAGDDKTWSLYNDNGEYYFYYDITGEELVTYLTINKIILQSSSDYTAFASAASTAAFTLNVKEDSASTLNTLGLSASQSSSNVALTITDDNTAGSVGYYLVSVYDNATLSSANIVGTLKIDIASSYTLLASYFEYAGISDGTYYVRVRAISADTTTYENSLLSDAITIVWNSTSNSLTYTT